VAHRCTVLNRCKSCERGNEHQRAKY
jgi:hypothetical protein